MAEMAEMIRLYAIYSMGKPAIWDFFVKVEFDASISSGIELTCVQVLDRSCTSLWRYSTLFAIAPHPQ